MDVLQVLISDIPHPVFIINKKNRQILAANEEASINGHNMVGEVFDDVVFVEEARRDVSYTFFNNQWFGLNQETFFWKDAPYIKIVLKRPESVPSYDMLQTLKNLTEALLHQFRSPLTGVQGYMDIMKKDLTDEPVKKLFGIWGRGITQLFDIMDELELFYNIPLNGHQYNIHPADITPVIQEVLDSYPPETRNFIELRDLPDPSMKFRCNTACLKRILSILIEDAIEHTSGKTPDITIDIPDNRSVTITRGGKPIPESVASQLFYPFITSKANSLGIGLTKALLYANQFGGTILLTDNSPEGVSLTVRFPPLAD